MARYLITGAAGFTGIHLTAELGRRGHEVHGIVRDKSVKGVDGLFVAHVCELHDREQVHHLVDRVKPDKVVHLAGISFVGHGDVDEIYTTNLIATRYLLEALQKLQTPPAGVLIASSANVYGNRHEGVISEGNLPDPVNDYGVSKIAMEYMVSLFREYLPIVIVRPFNYTGVGQSINFLIPKIVNHLLSRAPVIELGNIDVERDWSDVRMIVDAYIRLLDEDAAIGGTFNVCSGSARSLREVFDTACSLAGHQMDIRVHPAFVRTSEVASLCGNKALLESIIGPTKAIPIEDTLRWMLDVK
jgi:nucleoside-diphosphate-sugar epimerase